MIRHRLHALCPYFAMFPEQFVKRQLVWSEPGDLVFDPFCGRGTTVFESLLNGRRAAGCDTNPVAVCVSMAKTNPPTLDAVLSRIREIESLPVNLDVELRQNSFFSKCFHSETLTELAHLRANLNWRRSKTDTFIAAVALGCLHGESHRSPHYFSNRMPRTISTKPEYSVRWWKERHLEPPRRFVFPILRDMIRYRLASPTPLLRGKVAKCDARVAASVFSSLIDSVSLVVTSPPYLDVTDFHEDQWLRLWFLGGNIRPKRRVGGDDRHTNTEKYWQFLTEAWTGISPLLRAKAQIVIRIGGKGFEPESVKDALGRSLRAGLDRKVRLVEDHLSQIVRGQLQAFRPNAEGIKREFDFRYVVS